MRKLMFPGTALIALVLMFTQSGWSTSKLFKPVVNYSAGGRGSSSIVVADVNHDGKLDLIVANYCSQACEGIIPEGDVGILLGKGDGTFETPHNYSSGDYLATAVAVSDLNGDGNLDLVVTNACMIADYCNRGSVGVLLGLGNGDFLPVATYDSGGWWAESIAVGEVDGDGKADLLVANLSGIVGLLRGNGDGTFQPAETLISGGTNTYSIQVRDVNGDRNPDVLVANRDDSVAGVLLGAGDGTFQTVQTYASGGYFPFSITAEDVNGDGKLDILVANGCVSSNNCATGAVGVLLGNGDGTFETAQIFGSGGHIADSIAVGDVSRDGRPDLLVANACVREGGCAKGKLGVLLGKGDGTFQPAVTYALGVAGAAVATGDLNQDGKLDDVVAGVCGPFSCFGGGVSVLLGTARFTTTTTLTSNPNPSVFGQAVTFTAAVTSSGSIAPTGKVTFKNGGVAIGSGTVIGGVAKLITKNLPVGTLSIVAIYKGDGDSEPSTSSPLQQVVNP